MTLFLFFLVALALAGGGYFFAIRSVEPEAEKQAKFGFEDARARIEKAFSQPAVMNASVARNSNSFGCLYTAAADCSGAGGLFVLYESASPVAAALSQLRNDAGLSLDGMGCNSYPSPSCPFRVEASWSPICSPTGPCENTRSFKASVRLSYDDGKDRNEWSKEATFTPSIQLSAAAECERDGRVWAASECLSHDQAAQRELASRMPPQSNPRVMQAESGAGSTAPVERQRVVCDREIVIQGQTYSLSYISDNQAQAAVPAMNGCPAADVFTFQCQPKSPEDPYGQWIQIEAKMASPCDEQGNPLSGDNPRL